MDQVAERLAELRERRALTLRELGEMSGVAADTINQIELGHRKARPSTLRKLARALEIDVQEFYAEPALPKIEAPREAGRVEWDAAVRDAHRLRGHGRLRMEALLSSWRSRRDRGALREMGLLLQEAYDARNALWDNTSDDAGRLSLSTIPPSKWNEIAEADRLYLELVDMVLGAGDLRIRHEREAHEIEVAA
jgi:transcriptional regulator with XRE-family HTH domain